MDQSTHGIHRAFKISFRLSPLLLLIFVNACAEVQLNTIPTPSPTSKVRVFLHAFTGHAVQVRWADSDEKWARIQVQSVERFLKETAIYELPTEEEVAQVSRHKTFSIRDWSKKDWSLVRKMGQALHTDYAMVMERSAAGGFKYFDTLLINVETGKRFRISSRVKLAPANKEALFQMQMVAYNELFRDAKNDLLATAIRKGRLASPKSFPEQTSMPERGSAPIVVPPKTTETTSGSSGTQEVARELDYDKLSVGLKADKGRVNLAVYDLNTVEPYKVIAAILSEALREELFKLGRFNMVNREDMVKILGEMALQMTGLVDEKEAVRAGRGLAAQQIVLGNYGVLGKTSVLQSKRVDVETHSALGIGSLQCDFGKEDELLQHMTDLARKLAGPP